MENAVLDHAHQFLRDILPPPGPNTYLNIHWSGPSDNGGKFWDGRACETVDDAVRTLSWVNGMGNKDIYVCMSTQRLREEKTSAKGNKYFKAIRLAENVVNLRGFYADIDVKEGAYATQRDALAAVQKFLSDMGLPIPTAFVSSGSGGFHMHWVVERLLLPSEWLPMAMALSAALQTHGIKCDTQCTVDSARILRVPETFNRKTEEPRPVALMSLGAPTTMEVMEAALRPYFGAPGAAKPLPGTLPFVTPQGNFGEASDNSDLGAGVEAKRPEIAIDEVARSCPFVARTLGTGGKDNPQPLWFLTASLATFVEDGRDALHSMSDQHPGYSAKDTDALFDRTTQTQTKRNLGWPQCSKFSGYGAKECQTCPLLKNNKSPLNFALPAVAAVTDDSLPNTFVRGADGVISKRAINDDGTPLLIPICHYPITAGWLSNNPWTFHFTTRTEQGRKTVIEIPTEVIFCTDTQYKFLKEFFVTWLQKLQNQKDSVISASPFGWSVIDGKIEGFTFAGRVWTKDTDRPAANPNPVLSFQYTPKGDIATWSEVAKIVYEQKRPALDAILAVAFAGPLVRFTGFPGLILNAYSSESGIGKTTAMKASQSVWGHPVLAMQGLNDTSNSVLGKMGQIRSLPMYWDEIKSDAQVKRFCSIVFDLTGGREKTRMNADATLKLSGTWQTIMVSASNDTLVDGMAKEVGSTTAGLHRLFEYVVEKPAQVTHDVGAVQRLLGKLEDNYGHAGLTYAKFLGTHWARIEREVAALQDEIYGLVGAKQEERMWVSTIAVVLKGADYANELGLADIDTAGLRAFMLSTLSRMRGEVQESPSDLGNDMSVSSILAEFLNSTRSRNTLITNRLWVSKGKPPKGSVNIINDPTRIYDLAVHIGRDDKLIRISSTFLTRWMSERNYSRNTFVNRLTAEFGLTKVSGKLGGGTEMSCAMEHLLELDMNHKKLSAFLD
jgi:hypothetical protein